MFYRNKQEEAESLKEAAKYIIVNGEPRVNPNWSPSQLSVSGLRHKEEIYLIVEEDQKLDKENGVEEYGDIPWSEMTEHQLSPPYKTVPPNSAPPGYKWVACSFVEWIDDKPVHCYNLTLSAISVMYVKDHFCEKHREQFKIVPPRSPYLPEI